MSLSNVRSALVSAFLSGGIFPAENIAFENIAFTPGKEPWCQLSFVPAPPTVATLGAEGEDRFDGFLQLDLNYPLNSGDKAASDCVDAIRKLFTAGARFTYSGQEVVIASCGRSQGRTSSGFYRVSVTAQFYAHIQRQL
jgi:hypothetical protein